MVTKVLQQSNGDSLGSMADVQGTDAVQGLIAEFLVNEAVSCKAELVAELV